MWLRAIVCGLAAGALVALLANVAASALGMEELRSPDLTPKHVTTASLLTSVAGALVFAWLATRRPKPRRDYAVVTLAAATAATIKVFAVPPAPGFAHVAVPLHFVVAIASSIATPFLLDAGRKSEGARTSARCVLAVPALFTCLSAVIADFGDTHIENPRWPPHARFHGVLLVATMVMVGYVSIALLWRSFSWDAESERRVRCGLAAILPGGIWASFFLASLVHGTSSWPDGTSGSLPVAPNVILGGVMIVLCAIGWQLGARRSS
jgi:hypothetical protein